MGVIINLFLGKISTKDTYRNNEIEVQPETEMGKKLREQITGSVAK